MNFQKFGLYEGIVGNNCVCIIIVFTFLLCLPRVKAMENAIMKLHDLNSILSVAPLTLIHNDCNPRNICLRKSERTSEEEKHRTCLYDWELATLDVPQRDVVEFLAFVLSPSSSQDARLELINFYRCNLEHYSGIKYPLDRYRNLRFFN